uniref:Si:dkey-222p3.1 n=1 Tax=Sinocyclocheilus grahami TaxID=75366 RepID=A0A672PNB4_SINGR
VFCSVLLIFSASAQEVVQGFIGGSAVLPCHPGNRTLKNITAHWRYEDRKSVYDILNDQGMTKEQDPEYKGRTETFPAEYSKVNFTLKLGNLQKSDEGSYCFLEKPRGIQKPGSNSGGETSAGRIASLLIPLFSATVLLCV